MDQHHNGGGHSSSHHQSGSASTAAVDGGFGDFDLFLPSMERVVDGNGVFLEDEPQTPRQPASTPSATQHMPGMQSLPSFTDATGDLFFYSSSHNAPPPSVGSYISTSTMSDQDPSGGSAGRGPATKPKRSYTKKGSASTGAKNEKVDAFMFTSAELAGSDPSLAAAAAAAAESGMFSAKKYALPIHITPAGATSKKRNALGIEVSLAGQGTGSMNSPSGSIQSSDGEEEGGDDDDDKKNKRRKQIAAASRASRARRKRELEDLREENRRLREERSQFLSKIGDLQMKVEGLRERGSTDMRIENELLRAQLEEHKRFVSCFKRLCDGAPTSLNARHMIYKQGSDSAQAHVLSLISQSQADDWKEAIAPEGLNIPYQNFCMYYKFKSEYGEGEPSATASSSGSPPGKAKRRLNVRVDVLFPATDSSQISEFFWTSFASTDVQNRLYGVKGVELTQLADDVPDKDTKMIYYREKHSPPRKDVDWAIICNRRKRDLAKSTLAPPNRKGSKPQLGRASTIVTAMSTTQHSVAPQFENAERITSMWVQGCVTWNVGGDCRACIVFSFPEDFKVKALEGFSDVIDENGVMAKKFLLLLRGFNELLGEHASDFSSTTVDG